MDEIEKTEYEKRKWKEELVKPSKDLDKLENDNVMITLNLRNKN